MERRIGRLRADVIEPESAKFTAPLVLIHGLWSTTSLWHAFVGYLVHRGWLCVSVHLRRDGSSAPPSSLGEHLENLRSVVQALPAPPVVMGHDLGGLLAFLIADATTAVVSLAPLVPRPLAPLALGGPSWTDRFLRRPLRAPRGRWRAAYPPQAHRGDEPTGLLRELLGDDVRVPALDGTRPGLIVVGDRDPVTAVPAARAFAGAVGAELRVEGGAGHALPVEPGWERRVSDVHRWIVQQLGRPLLALYDESLDTES
jgi:pimeloyl-ACP methyl ester carboxylesterase